jgi:hypothetical protein
MLAKAIAGFGESVHMAGVLDGVFDEDMRLAIAKVTSRAIHFYVLHYLFMHHAH